MLLAREIHLHFRRHVFHGLSCHIHQSLLHRPGEREPASKAFEPK